MIDKKKVQRWYGFKPYKGKSKYYTPKSGYVLTEKFQTL